jgi:hypothetical protein
MSNSQPQFMKHAKTLEITMDGKVKDTDFPYPSVVKVSLNAYDIFSSRISHILASWLIF